MSVAATAAITAANAANAANIVSRKAQQTKTADCVVIVNNFDSKATTIQEAQNYATCIQYLYPVNNTSQDLIVGKVIVVYFFLAAVVGFFYGKFILKDIMAGILTGLLVSMILCFPIGGLFFIFFV